MILTSAIKKLQASASLSIQETEDVFSSIFHHEVSDNQIREFLVHLYQKGETYDEIMGAVRFLRSNGVSLDGGEDLLDCCGTGGDQKGTLNISTAVAFVLAGGGIKVAKHGNRAVSSLSGSADVLKEFGVNITMSEKTTLACLKNTGITFLWAPQYYPILKKVGEIRKSIPHRTIFNLLGPLLNPMKATRQLLGVFDKNFVPILARVLKDNASTAAIVVSSEDGLDEFSLTAKAYVASLQKGIIKEFIFDPWKESGYPHATILDLKGGTPSENALRIRRSLKGHSEPVDHVIHINAAWGFIVAGKAESFMDGLILAQDSISSGKAYRKLEEFVEASHA